MSPVSRKRKPRRPAAKRAPSRNAEPLLDETHRADIGGMLAALITDDPALMDDPPTRRLAITLVHSYLTSQGSMPDMPGGEELVESVKRLNADGWIQVRDGRAYLGSPGKVGTVELDWQMTLTPSPERRAGATGTPTV